MLILAALFWVVVLAGVLEMERYELAQRSGTALPGAVIVVLAAALALWTLGGMVK